MRPGFLLALLSAFTGLFAQVPIVLHHWSGGLGAREIRVNAMLSDPCDSLRLIVDNDPAFGSPQYSAWMSADTAHGLMARFRRGGLQPSTHYRYRFEVGGRMDTTAANTGRFRTPAEGATSFSFVTGSCNSNSDHPVWQSMRWLQPDLFVALGDLHYGDPVGTDPAAHRQAYLQHIYQHVGIMDLLHEVPLAYVWDDHDYCGNGSDGASPGRAAAAQAYREHVPHYTLPDGTSIHQAFTIGRVHFILSDLRSSKSPVRMMDDAQRAWLQGELLHARDSGLVACWVSALTWNAIDYPENWGSCPQEREALSNWLLANGIKDLFILSGDAHMLAIDDGANADFSTDQQSPYRYPIFQAAAINRGGSYKGGTFNQGGVHPNPGAWIGQFGQVIVDDDGDDVCITFNGWRTDSMSAAMSLVNTYTFCRNPPQAGLRPGTDEGPQAWWAQGMVHVRWPGAGGSGRAVCTDVTGRVIQDAVLNWSQGEATLPLSHTAEGMILVTFIHGTRTATLRIVLP